jgi:DUF4097 and DUF4098 domain-containing protein YvlB
MFCLELLLLAGLVSGSGLNFYGLKNFDSARAEKDKIIRPDEVERFEQTYPLNPDGKVSVSNVNGSITIETWDKPQVKIEVVKTADSKDKLSEVEIKIDARQEYFKVETDYGSWKNRRIWNRAGNLEVDYRLIVPRKAVLDEIETVNGSINITDANNLTRASAVNGQVKAVNLRGTVGLSTVNGSIVAEFDELQNGSKISLNTVNGQITLTIPSDANATVKASTISGNIVNDFNLPVRKGKYFGRDLMGKTGNGDVQIQLSSVNGELVIKRKNDGKNLNPVTNLLPNDRQERKVLSNIAEPDEEVSKVLKQAQEKLAEQVIKQATEVAGQVTTGIMKTEKMQDRLKAAQERLNEAMLKAARENFIVGLSNIWKKSESFPVKDIAKVTIEAQNCEISVRGWEKPEVRYAITHISNAPAEKKPDLKTEHKGTEVNIRIINPGESRDFLNRPRIEVFVPEKSHLKIFTNSEVRLENISGEINIEGAQEAINVRDSGGKLRVANTDGSVRVIGFKGETEIQTIKGEISLEGDFTKITAWATDGTFVLTLPENANVDIETNTEKFSIETAFPPKKINEKVWRFGSGGLKYNFMVGNGKIFVRNAGVLTTRF